MNHVRVVKDLRDYFQPTKRPAGSRGFREQSTHKYSFHFLPIHHLCCFRLTLLSLICLLLAPMRRQRMNFGSNGTICVPKCNQN